MTNQLLSKTQKTSKRPDRQLNLIRNKIRNRKNIISNLEKQSGLIENNIGAKNTTIRSLEQDLNRLRQEYAAMVYDSYKNSKAEQLHALSVRIAGFQRRYAADRPYAPLQPDGNRKPPPNRFWYRPRSDAKYQACKVRRRNFDKCAVAGNEELTSLTRTKRSTAPRRRNCSRSGQTELDHQGEQEADRTDAESDTADHRRRIAQNKAKPQTSEQREFDVKLSGQFEQNTGKLPASGAWESFVK